MNLLSHSKWSRLLPPIPHVHHGEKSSLKIRPQAMYYNIRPPPNYQSGELIMLNCDTMETETMLLQCVNPHLVNPMDSYCQSLEASVQGTDDTQTPHKGLLPQLKMEEFNDLSLYIPASAVIPKSQPANELNTPIFEEPKEFNFAAQASSTDMWDSLKFNNELFEFTANNVKYVGDNTINEMNNKVVDKAIILPVKSEEVYDKQVETPVYIETFEHDYDGSRTGYSDITSVCSSPRNNQYETLDDSFMPEEYDALRPTNLQLNVGIKLFQDSISTPDIIDAVTSLESTFNIFATEKGPADIIKLEEDLRSLLSEPSPSESSPPELSPCTSVFCDPRELETTPQADVDSDIEDATEPIQQKRKRKAYESDEEYVPPLRIKAKRRRSDSTSDSDEEFVPAPKKRGRPPGRRSSIVSHISSVSACSSETNADRYRELRDKNNEASRKSRAKRRMKEQQVTNEADNLEDRNIKLKAQVEELERTIKSYKDNLFKFVLSK